MGVVSDCRVCEIAFSSHCAVFCKLCGLNLWSQSQFLEHFESRHSEEIKGDASVGVDSGQQGQSQPVDEEIRFTVVEQTSDEPTHYMTTMEALSRRRPLTVHGDENETTTTVTTVVVEDQPTSGQMLDDVSDVQHNIEPESTSKRIRLDDQLGMGEDEVLATNAVPTSQSSTNSSAIKSSFSTSAPATKQTTFYCHFCEREYLSSVPEVDLSHHYEVVHRTRIEVIEQGDEENSDLDNNFDNSKPTSNVSSGENVFEVMPAAAPASGTIESSTSREPAKPDRWECTACQRTFRSYVGMSAHERKAHTNDKLLACIKCDLSYHTRKRLLDHMKKEHDDLKNAEECPLCDYVGVPHLLYKHMVNRHVYKKELPHCLRCDDRFDDIVSLIRHHQANHKPVEPYKCTVCQESFKLERYLEEHERRMHGSSKRRAVS